MTGPQLPWPAGRRPLSVVAFGNSVTFLQLPARTDRAHGTYLEVLADDLTAAGVPVQTHLEGKWFDFVHRAVREYQSRVRPHSPDVVIVQFGLNEMQPWLAPVWLLRHLLQQDAAVGRVAVRYRRHVAKPLWRWLRTYRRWAAPLVGTSTWQLSPRRFAGHLRRIIRLTRLESRALVLVLDVDEPTGSLLHFLPGLERRREIFQQVIADVVASMNDPDVRLVHTSELTGDDRGARPDGMHWTPQTHGEVGHRLAGEISAWLRERAGRPPGS